MQKSRHYLKTIVFSLFNHYAENENAAILPITDSIKNCLCLINQLQSRAGFPKMGAILVSW